MEKLNFANNSVSLGKELEAFIELQNSLIALLKLSLKDITENPKSFVD